MNLWHDIEIGKNFPEEFNCVVAGDCGFPNLRRVGCIFLLPTNNAPVIVI